MDKLHKEYIKYYETRMNKYKGNPSYKNSYETEKALYDAIASCEKLEDFKDKVEKGNLAVNNGVALVKDKEKIQNEHYNKLKEFIRAGASKEILETLGKKEIKTAMELANLCTEIEQKHHLKITLDELGITQFLFDYFILENIEAWQNAEVVDEFKKEINEDWPNDTIKEGIKQWKENILPNNHAWDPKWNMDYDLIFKEERHRRRIPFPDEIVKKRFEQHKKYRGI